MGDDSASSHIRSSLKTVSAYSELKVHFWFFGIDMQEGDTFHFDVRFSGTGSNWVSMATYAVGVDFENRKWTEKTVSFPRLKNKVKISFRGGGEDNSRKIFLDDITFCGQTVATPTPINPPTPVTSGDPCCPEDYTGLRAWNNCYQYYHCVNGVVTGDLLNAPQGTLFDQNLQNNNWADQVTCVVDSCGR